MTARLHHYVPQCYLSGFAVQRKNARQVHVFDRTRTESFISSIRNVGGERDFNRIDVPDHEPDAFEKGTAKFESELAPALTRVIQRQSLADFNDKNYVLNLIALLAVRNPSMRENVRGFHERVAKVMLEIVTATPERWAVQARQMHQAGYLSSDNPVRYEDIRKGVENLGDRYRLEVPTEQHLIYEVEGVDAILPYLGMRRWLLIKAPDSSGGFITCDHPVALVWADPPTKGVRRPPGFGLQKTEVVFPLSSRLAMLGSFELDADDAFEANNQLVAELNSLTIAFSRRQVYARDLHFHYTDMRGGELRNAQRLARDAMFHKKVSR